MSAALHKSLHRRDRLIVGRDAGGSMRRQESDNQKGTETHDAGQREGKQRACELVATGFEMLAHPESSRYR
jgi:hypothetical protein